MMRRIAVVLLCWAPAGTAWTQPDVLFPDSPWDFGEMLQQESASHRFEVRNVGTDTLFISRVNAACGCTSAPLTKDIVAPGESIWLDITFNSKKFSGQVNKKVVVYSNDPDDPRASIEFTAQVETSRKRVAPVTEPADLGNLVPNRPRQTAITLTNVGTEPYRLSLADWPSSWLEPDWTERVIDPGDSLDLKIGTRGFPPLGKFSASLTFDVQGSEKSRLSMPVTGVGLVE
jgi:hypothetical protein